jgi:hypothetical protein
LPVYLVVTQLLGYRYIYPHAWDTSVRKSKDTSSSIALGNKQLCVSGSVDVIIPNFVRGICRYLKHYVPVKFLVLFYPYNCKVYLCQSI